MKGLMDAAAAREKKIAPPLKQYLRRSNADFAGMKEHPPTTTVSLASKLAAFDKHVSNLEEKFKVCSDRLDEIDLILENLFPEEDSEETEEYDE